MFHESGPAIVNVLNKKGLTVEVYIVDGEFIEDPSDLLVPYSTSLIVQLRLTIPIIPIP